MKNVLIRKDLMSKSQYSKAYRVNRVTLDKRIKEGKLSAERISGVDYIKLEDEK
jgi:hypothetical protein